MEEIVPKKESLDLSHYLDEFICVHDVHLGNDITKLIKLLRREPPTDELLRNTRYVVTLVKDNDSVLIVNVKSFADLQAK